MLAHVALLRGINVGGKNIIRMDALAASFVRLGFESVKTFIASGNVVFCAPKQDLRALEKRIETELTKAHAYDATVVVKSAPEMAAMVRKMPRTWAKPDAAWRYYVIFLRHEIDSRAVLDELQPKAGVETLDYAPGVLYWAAKRAALARSSVAKLGRSKLYRYVTVRNLNTSQKLAELVQSANR